MENIEKLSAALVKAQKEMKVAAKDCENPFFKSKYADLASVWKACHEALSENGIAVVQGGAFRDGHFFMTTTLVHSSGQTISGDYLIKPIKEDPQAYGSAWTYARRYSLAAMVGVMSDDDDGNAATGKPQVTEAVRQTFQKAPEATAKGAPLSTANMISSAQAKRFYAIAKSNNKSDDEIKAYMRESCGAERTEFIPRDKYEAACLWAGEKPAEVPF